MIDLDKSKKVTAVLKLNFLPEGGQLNIKI